MVMTVYDLNIVALNRTILFLTAKVKRSGHLLQRNRASLCIILEMFCP